MLSSSSLMLFLLPLLSLLQSLLLVSVDISKEKNPSIQTAIGNSFESRTLEGSQVPRGRRMARFDIWRRKREARSGRKRQASPGSTLSIMAKAGNGAAVYLAIFHGAQTYWSAGIPGLPLQSLTEPCHNPTCILFSLPVRAVLSLCLFPDVLIVSASESHLLSSLWRTTRFSSFFLRSSFPLFPCAPFVNFPQSSCLSVSKKCVLVLLFWGSYSDTPLALVNIANGVVWLNGGRGFGVGGCLLSIYLDVYFPVCLSVRHFPFLLSFFPPSLRLPSPLPSCLPLPSLPLCLLPSFLHSSLLPFFLLRFVPPAFPPSPFRPFSLIGSPKL